MAGLLIVGMNNPQSLEALSTMPRGGAGHRLWLMATARTGVSEQDWLQNVDRVNLCGGEWDPFEARRAWGQGVVSTDRYDAIMFLGNDVVNATGLRLPPIGRRGIYWVLPHPSGRNRWYNDELNKDAATLLLRDFYNLRLEKC